MTSSLVDVVFRAAFADQCEARKAAEQALRAGRETLIHTHINQAASDHRYCELYVLDWHDEPEYVGYKQIAVVSVPEVAGA